MLTILIIEDNPEELNYCCNIIYCILKECQILKAESAEKALQFLSEYKVDLFFIDVDLPGMNGFQLAEEIRKKTDYIITTIVFLTGYQTNQLSIHQKYHHYEYIEKPYTQDSFTQRVGPLLKGLQRLYLQNICEHVTPRQKLILIETNNETCFVDFNDILYVETEGRTLKLHTKKKVLSNVTNKMTHFIKDVNSPSFVRCHKSYAVNVNNIQTIKHTSRRLWTAYFNENETCYCTISKTYYEKTYQHYLKMMKHKE